MNSNVLKGLVIVVILCTLAYLFNNFIVYRLVTAPTLQQVKFIDNTNEPYLSLIFNVKVKHLSNKLELKNKDNNIIWVGEEKKLCSDLGDNVFELLINDIKISKNLNTNVLHTLTLNKNINYVITYPPDDSLTAIYFGSYNYTFNALRISYINKEIRIIVSQDHP